ncbi:unnamed protein product [Camellia sinensis]
MRSRRRVPSIEEDAALARRLRREEYMEAFLSRGSGEQHRSSLSLATQTRFRAMAVGKMVWKSLIDE